MSITDERVGRRVELVSTSDPHTKLKPGDQGEVVLVDSMDTVHVKWDSGSSLGMIAGEDRFRYIDGENA